MQPDPVARLRLLGPIHQGPIDPTAPIQPHLPSRKRARIGNARVAAGSSAGPLSALEQLNVATTAIAANGHALAIIDNLVGRPARSTRSTAAVAERAHAAARGWKSGWEPVG
jgi:hypothetical protein